MNEGYDPEWLELEAALGQRPVLSGDVDHMIEQYNTLGAALAEQWGPPSNAVQAYDEKINENVTVRIFAPAHQKEPLPVGVYFHGGGYMAGLPALEDPICRIISERTPCIIVSVDYRLAPKYKLPTGINDGYDAFLWAYENASKLNGNPLAYFAIGGSAGGGLAFSVTEKLIRNGQRGLVQGVVALNPITTHMDNPPAKYKSIYTSYSENANVPLVDRYCMDMAFGASAVQQDDSLVFVTLSQNLSSYPPVYIATCGKDILRDDGVVLERLLQDAGVKVKRDHYARFPHYFFIFPSVKTSLTYVLNAVEGIKFVLNLE